MSVSTDIGTLISASPEIRGGRPRIAGTGVTVHRVVIWYKLGLTPEEIADRIGHLTLAQVHASPGHVARLGWRLLTVSQMRYTIGRLCRRLQP